MLISPCCKAKTTPDVCGNGCCEYQVCDSCDEPVAKELLKEAPNPLYNFVHSSDENKKQIIEKAVLKANEEQRKTMAVAEAVIEERREIVEQLERMKKNMIWDENATCTSCQALDPDDCDCSVYDEAISDIIKLLKQRGI